MSNRTLIELNHDHCPDGLELVHHMGEGFRYYMCTGDKKTLPKCATFIAMRHHSEPEPILVTREQLEAIQWGDFLERSQPVCPACEAYPGNGHEDDCWIRKALAK